METSPTFAVPGPPVRRSAHAQEQGEEEEGEGEDGEEDEDEDDGDQDDDEDAQRRALDDEAAERDIREAIVSAVEDLNAFMYVAKGGWGVVVRCSRLLAQAVTRVAHDVVQAHADQDAARRPRIVAA